MLSMSRLTGVDVSSDDHLVWRQALVMAFVGEL
jgi:hypothetical protein